jgi:hypothetical protein
VFGEPQIGLDVVAKKVSLSVPDIEYCNTILIYREATIHEMKN